MKSCPACDENVHPVNGDDGPLYACSKCDRTWTLLDDREVVELKSNLRAGQERIKRLLASGEEREVEFDECRKHTLGVERDLLAELNRVATLEETVHHIENALKCETERADSYSERIDQLKTLLTDEREKLELMTVDRDVLKDCLDGYK